ncbi:hypothetical protein [Luteimonas sp. R10]|uniref:hypothetical protein n=1 Tax=Luteimonas sp. R10 TaxID=3108176 RepID=UPI00308E198F|nr:hypothetical protein U3649_01955 [Luteimonas sp. R10]
MHSTVRPWMEQIEQLRSEGVIDADDENVLIRHVNDHQSLIERELASIAPEYERRVAADGQERADLWLQQCARELGTREGEKMRRIFDQLSCGEQISDVP